MQRDKAEEIGLRALGWVAGNDELLPVFLGSSGAGLEDLKAGAGDPAFLGAILDFLLMDDAWVVAFCDSEGLAYEVLMAARAALPGGEQVNWT